MPLPLLTPIRLMLLMGAVLLYPCRTNYAAEHDNSPQHGFKALVFSKTAGFRHASIEAGIAAVQALALEHDFEVDVTEDAEAFTATNLMNYAVVIFLNTTGNVLNDAQQTAFEAYIRSGGGFVGIHAAADTEYDWPFYGGLVGAYFESHPSGTPLATIKVVDTHHPSTQPLPKRWQRTDEWYNFRENPRGKVHVLATLDETTYSGGTMGADHPIAWCHTYEGGRSWYTAGGHTSETYAEPLFREHLLLGIEYAAQAVSGACGATVWSNYDKVTLDANTENPIALDVAPDGRVFFVERAGAVRIHDPSVGTTQTAGTLDVVTSNEDGLIGIALDPDFANNNWVYLFYSPQSEADKQHVSRFTLIDDALDFNSEVIILEIPVQRDQCCHSGGAMLFGPAGDLYIATGDNTNPFESGGFTPIDERTNRNAWDAQKSSGNTHDLRGKILRIMPQPDGSYTIPDGNLFATTEEGLLEIYIMGTRNPFRFSVDAATGWLYWGDVGPDAASSNATRGPQGYDEWNQARAAGNYGWPYCIADNQAYHDYDFGTATSGALFDCANLVNDSPNNTGSTTLPPAQPAWIWYPYGLSSTFPGLAAGEGRTAMAGPVYHVDPALESATQLPAYFDNTLFIYEWARNWIHEVKIDDDGGVLAIQPFVPDFELLRPIDMKLGPDGALYLLEWGTGFGGNNADSRLVRIDYVEGSRAPVITATVSPSSGLAPLTVQFSSTGTFDPDPGETLSYAWDFETDGIIDATDPNPSHTYVDNGTYTALLTVTDSEENTAFTSFEIIVGNSQPSITLMAPASGTFFEWGEPVAFALSVSDPEDGTTDDGSIDCTSVTLQLFLGHDDHTHPLDQINDCSGAFTVSDEDHGGEGDRLFYVVEASYTDQGMENISPLTARTQHVLQPKRLEAEQYTNQQGVLLEASQDILGGGTHLAFIDHGDYASYSPINLSNIIALTFRVASAGAGGRIVVRIDDVDGPLLGEAHVSQTGSWQVFQDVTIPIEDPGGEHELFLIFENAPGVGGLFNVNWIDFHGAGVRLDAPERGLEATYFPNQDLSGAGTMRMDAQISFNWSTAPPFASFANDAYSVQWSAMVTPSYSEAYQFYARSDDGMRVWLNDNLIIDNWRVQPVTEVGSASIALEAGQSYPLIVEYYEAAGEAQAHLLWESPSVPKQTVPYGALTPAPVASSSANLPSVPTTLMLQPIFPNPAQNSATIRFTLPQPAHTTVQLYDPLGRLIQTIQDGVLPAQTHTIQLHTSDLASGIYLIRLHTPTAQRTQHVVVVQ